MLLIKQADRTLSHSPLELNTMTGRLNISEHKHTYMYTKQHFCTETYFLHFRHWLNMGQVSHEQINLY